MNNLKSCETYQYLHCNKVGRVLLKGVEHDLMYLKADAEPSQSLKVPHHRPWVLVSTSWTVEMAGCTCVAGQGRFCSHAAAILWKVDIVLVIFKTIFDVWRKCSMKPLGFLLSALCTSQ